MTSTLVPHLRSARVDRVAPREPRRFRPDIEGLRAVAVTTVVVSHLSLGLPGGYVGVDVFFVISGFLITRQLMSEFTRTGRLSLTRFYARRARRILPAATVVSIATLLACRIWDSPLRVRTDAMDALYAAFSGINWRLARAGTDYFTATLPPSPYQHYWSLAVEEQFYIVWPALLLAVGVLLGRRYGRVRAVVWCLVAILLGSLALSVLTTASNPSWAYFGTQTRAWELALGALLAVSVTTWTRMPPALASQMSWLGLGFIVLSCFVFNSSTVYPGRAAVLPVLGSGMVIAGGCPGWSRSAELVLGLRPLQFVGRVSYSWYLVHWPVLTILPIALGHGLSEVERGGVVVGSLGLAVAMFFVVEQPPRRLPALVYRPNLALALGLVLILTAGTVAVTVSDLATVPGGNGEIVQGAATDSSVMAAVAAAAALKSLPRNVTPALAQASGDHPRTGRCLVPETATEPPPNSTCTFGDPSGTRTMVVMGDSHAQAWEPAIDAFGKTNAWRVILFTKGACPPGIYLNYLDPQTNRIYTQCNAWRNAVFQRVNALKPQAVLLTSELRPIDIDPTGTVEAIRILQRSGAHVIYLQDTPSPLALGSIPDCLARHASDLAKCSLPRRDPATRLEGMIQRAVEAKAVQAAGASLIDPTKWFCTATDCPPVINNIVVYSDATHTTATYVSWLAPVMNEALVKATGNVAGG
jgi:peptidoglycan/LPS O-acetylase OafA/YrhL